MDDRQKLKPDLKDIYERVMNTPVNKPASTATTQTPQPPQPKFDRPAQINVVPPPKPEPVFMPESPSPQNPNQQVITQQPQVLKKQEEIMSKEPPFFTLNTQDTNSVPPSPQPVSPTSTFSTLVKESPIPNPVIAGTKPKGSKIWGFLLIIFFIAYTIFWLVYFKVVDKTILDMLTSKLGTKIM